VVRLRRFSRISPDGREGGSGIILRGRKKCQAQVAIKDHRQEKIRQKDKKAKKSRQEWLPVDESALRVALHPRISGKRLKMHSVTLDKKNCIK
jgi:hypothetical protein